MLLTPEEMFFRAFRHPAFDVSELSLSSCCVSVARAEPDYVAVSDVARLVNRSSCLWGRRAAEKVSGERRP